MIQYGVPGSVFTSSTPSPVALSRDPPTDRA